MAQGMPVSLVQRRNRNQNAPLFSRSLTGERLATRPCGCASYILSKVLLHQVRITYGVWSIPCEIYVLCTYVGLLYIGAPATAFLFLFLSSPLYSASRRVHNNIIGLKLDDLDQVNLPFNGGSTERTCLRWNRFMQHLHSQVLSVYLTNVNA